MFIDYAKIVIASGNGGNGAISFRKNGKSEIARSTANIEIKPKQNGQGIDIFVRSTCQGEACHIPVVVSESGLFDMVYNDFYIEESANVLIVAGCGIHSGGDAGHNGIHSFHIGKNAIQRMECGKRFVTDIEIIGFTKVFNTTFEELLK